MIRAMSRIPRTVTTTPKVAYAAFRLNWPDRRPICVDYLTGGPLNTDSAANVAFYRSDLMAKAELRIAAMSNNGAQGYMLWDAEGGWAYASRDTVTGNNLAYAGDPRLVPIYNLAFNAIADDYFGLFKSKGFRVGGTIRCHDLINNQSQKVLTFVRPVNPLQSLQDKVRYAHDRWGWTLFYLDSYDWTDTTGVLDKLQTLFPDCLFMPESGQERVAPWLNAYSAPMVPAFLGQWQTPTIATDIYPQAFSAILLHGAWDAEQAKAAMSRGNILCETWSGLDRLTTARPLVANVVKSV